MPTALRWFLALSGILSLCSLVYVIIQFKYASGIHHGLPYDLYTTHPFEDLNAFSAKVGIVHTPEFFTVDWKWLYPAPCIFIYLFFSLFDRLGFRGGKPSHWCTDLAFCVVVFAVLFVLARRAIRALETRGLKHTDSRNLIWGALFSSWPIYYGVHQGNIESLLWIGVAAAIWFYCRDKWWTSALLIGFVGSFKLYPLLFLGLFVLRRKYAHIAASLFIFLLTTLLALAFIGPTIPSAYHFVKAGVATFSAIGLSLEGVQPFGRMFDHSLAGLLHLLLKNHPTTLVTTLKYYMAGCASVALILFFTRISKMPRINKILFITLAAVFLPPTSFDYTLELLYIPWMMLAMLTVSAEKTRHQLRGAFAVMICLALLCAPELFLQLHGSYVYGQFKAAVILVLLVLTLLLPFPEPISPTVLNP